MKNPIIKIHVRDLGVMTAELYPDKAPKTVENFLGLVKSGFYSGLIFHRVIQGFMIQGGGYDEAFEDKDAPAIRGEFRANGFAQNDLKHARGVLSMARTSNPNSASSQFFVMHQNAPHLDGQHAADAENRHPGALELLYSLRAQQHLGTQKLFVNHRNSSFEDSICHLQKRPVISGPLFV